MKKQQNNPTIFLKDYTPSNYTISEVMLDFFLDEERTIVKSSMQVIRNNKATSFKNNLILDGGSDLNLLKISLDDKDLTENDYVLEQGSLRINELPDNFNLKLEVQINPAANTQLEGLYLSNNTFTTQCEAQGFRHITYFLDRPDVLAKYTVSLTADKEKFPVLFSNGNLIKEESLPEGRHKLTWQDPHPKPSYLFALVAGDLGYLSDNFTTMENREVKLRIYADHKDLHKCKYALSSLKKSMLWDEQVYSLAYDLDLYMIVAISDFNSGAMENKGLNIFNAKYVFADSETATDLDFKNIERIIAHEYFHNYSGNRVTLRDWFQLSLKEGLTVYRENSFAADMNSPLLERIDEYETITGPQFTEDASAIAHAVRPSSYQQIRNFYTTTVYEKGSELIRMYETILGKEGYLAGVKLYMQRHDGSAATVEDFLSAMSEANNVDLTQFKLWYSQAGTPLVEVVGEYSAEKQEYTLHCKQSCRVTPETTDKLPFLIPVKVSLLSDSGLLDLSLLNSSTEYKVISDDTVVLLLSKFEQSFTFTKIANKPTPSLLQGFSAPVKLDYAYSDEQIELLLEQDNDLFNRYILSRKLLCEEIKRLSAISVDKLAEASLSDKLVKMLSFALKFYTKDKAAFAKIITLPSFNQYLNASKECVDVDRVLHAIKTLQSLIGKQFYNEFYSLYSNINLPTEYQPEPEDIALRACKSVLISYLFFSKQDAVKITNLLQEEYTKSSNMTEKMNILNLVAGYVQELRESMLQDFYTKWEAQELVVNKWLTLSVSYTSSAAIDIATSLLTHKSFSMKNPNKVYALLFGLVRNPFAFHESSGRGYKFIADCVLTIDEFNSQLAARIAKCLLSIDKLDEKRQSLVKEQLARIRNSNKVSSDTLEVINAI